MKFVLLPCSSEDSLFLAHLFADVRTPEFAPLGLPAPVLDQLIAMQFQAQSASYAGQFPDAQDQIIWIESTRVGRLLVHRSNSAMQLIDIAILAGYRGQGIGSLVLEGLCEEARRGSMLLCLSVRYGNPAERLYERVGFVRTGGDGVNITMEFRGAHEETARSESELSTLTEVDEPVEQGLTGRYFRTLIGETVTARSSDGTVAQLVLEDVHSLKAPTKGAIVEVGDSFVLRFSGPVSPVLPSAEVLLTPPNAAPMDIFLVPLGPRDGVMKYEAVFNRMKTI